MFFFSPPVPTTADHNISGLRRSGWLPRGISFLLALHFYLCLFQFAPQLVIVSAGYDAALGDEKVRPGLEER